MTGKADSVLLQLNALASPENVEGMKRYGINSQGTLGVSIYTLRPIAKEIGTDHALALELWKTGIHEARILACFIDDPGQVDEAQMEDWVKDFDSWDVCDQVCSSLFDQTAFAYQKAFEWAERREEFVKRAGFVLMAALAVHDRQAADDQLAVFFPVIIAEAGDPRNFVKKAVNWALRNIGKRNLHLNQLAIETAQVILANGTPTGRWIANDALRELTAEKIQARIKH
jgi:3-methyladenine DNA glycosylase AlkD